MGEIHVIAAAVVFPTLLVAGCAHLLHPSRLAEVLRLHGWPAVVSRSGSVLVAVAETAVGAAGAVGVAAGPATPAAGALRPLVAVAAALLFVAYAVDAGRVLRTGSDVPCGCGAKDQPVNQWVVVRAAAYACLALAAALPQPGLGDLAPLAAVTAIVAAGVVGLLLWLLPRTLAIPPGFALDT
jgi:hypothetical protein